MEPVLLDVRPFHDRGEEPFSAIMSAVEELPADRALLLINSFEPTPLFSVMRRKGFSAACEQVGPEEYHIVFRRA